MFRLVHATPIHPSLCLPYRILLLPLLLLLLCCCCFVVATTKLLLLINFYEQEIFPGAAELTTQLLRLASILWLPCVESINWVILPMKTVAIPYTCGSSLIHRVLLEITFPTFHDRGHG